MKRILFIQGTSEIGGSDLCLLEIIENLDREAFRPVVVLPHPGPLRDRWERSGAHIRIMDPGALRRGNLLPRRQAVADLARLVRDEGISLVHSNSSIVLGGAGAARAAGVPHVWHVREFLEPSGVIAPLLRRWIAARSDRIVTISSALASRFRGLRHARGKVRIIRDGVDLDRYRPGTRRDPGLEPGEVVVGTIGRIHPLKGVHDLLEALALAARTRPHLRLMVVGEEPSPRQRPYGDSLRRRAGGPDLRGRVIFTGRREDVPEVLRGMDIFVLPSRHPEGLGKAAAEAMAAGRAVIATRTGGPEDLITHRESGILTFPRDPEAMAAALGRLADHPVTRRTLGLRARAFAEAHLDVRDRVRDLSRVWREVLR